MNKGLTGLSSDGDIDKLLQAGNSCSFEIDQDTRGGIRVRLQGSDLVTEIRNADDDTSYRQCSSVRLKSNKLNYFNIVADNFDLLDMKRVSDIDIDGIYFKNMDQNAYQDEQKLENMKLVKMAAKHKIEVNEDGAITYRDIMSMQMKDDLKRNAK